MSIIRDKRGNYTIRKISSEALLDLAADILAENTRNGGKAFTSPDVTEQFIKLKIGLEQSEVFGVMFLDNKHRLISFDRMFNGTIDGASVHPREVVRRALQHNAAAAVLAHNHPSGDCQPSSADKRITERLKTALELIDVRILDHIIVSGDNSYSFAQTGCM
jgi:DNA repair protein RadC